MATENQSNIDVNALENMSQAELEKLEDETVLVDGEETSGEASPALKPDTDQSSEGSAETTGDGVDGEKAKSEGDAEVKTELTGDQTVDDELTKHVSPPSKWAAERLAKRELATRLDEAETKAAKADVLEQELNDMKSELDWMKTAIQSKGVTLPESPLDVFNEEKITEIRDEYGDELADMFQATATILQKQSGGKPAAPGAAKQTEEETTVPAKTEQQEVQKTESTVDPALMEAIDNNDELAYWREFSAPLWNKAVELDSKLLADPEYAKLPYAQRFAKVVEDVKTDVTKGATSESKSNDNSPPESLSGSGGVAPTQNSNDALEKILATDDPDAQLKIYNALPQSQKDEVDKALNI